MLTTHSSYQLFILVIFTARCIFTPVTFWLCSVSTLRAVHQNERKGSYYINTPLPGRHACDRLTRRTGRYGAPTQGICKAHNPAALSQAPKSAFLSKAPTAQRAGGQDVPRGRAPCKSNTNPLAVVREPAFVRGLWYGMALEVSQRRGPASTKHHNPVRGA